MPGDTPPLKRRTRILIAIAAWIIIGPLCWGFFQFAWWLGVGLAVLLLWVTYDYIRKGDMVDYIQEGMSREGDRLGKGAEEVLGHEEN